MQKEIIVLSDIEMGAGSLTDDFISDNALSGLISGLAKKKHPVELVLNGDTFDLLKCPSQLDPAIYPRYITEDISIKKMKLVFNAHKRVFDAFSAFVSKKDKSLYFVIGNHDVDIVFPGVQKLIKSRLKNNENVNFPGFFYDKHDVYVEHGHQYDFANRMDPEKLFVEYGGRKILNQNFVSFVVIGTMISMKEQHPFIERIKPVKLLFSLNKTITKKFNRKLIPYSIKSALYYPLRYYSDPTYLFPTGLIREFFERLKSWDWDVREIVPAFKKKQMNRKIVVFGHVHKSEYIEESEGQTILRGLPWRDEYLIDEKTRQVVPRKKKYVQISVLDDEKLTWKIRSYPIKRSVLRLDNIAKDEIKHLLKAANEEGYKIVKTN